MPTELPASLRRIAAELDELGGPRPGHPSESIPDFRGTDFELERELGRGGMGIVYLARQISLARLVAVKILPPAFSRSETFRARFADESRLVAQLHHPGIIDVYAAGSCGKDCYFAMEYVEGATVRDHVFKTLEDVAALGLCAAEALAYAHDCGILHRDIKPANILVNAQGRVKIGDFGLACLAGRATDAAGTRAYMAPELLRGESASVQTDVYALGATLLEEAQPLLELHPNADFAAILSRATHPDPARRYGSMSDLADELDRWLHHEPLKARPPGLLHRLALWARRNPSAALGALVAALLAAGLFAALTVGYFRTRSALAQVENEAVHTAEALVSALTATDEEREFPDKRLAKLKRAKGTLEQLQARFPDNKKIAQAVARLVRALEFTAGRGTRLRGRSRAELPGL